MEYNFGAIEKKWQQYWKDHDIYKVTEDKNKPKYYVLDMFPYPSGAGLHVGHPLGYVASDIVARYKKLCGYNVLHPMGFDAFGLPAEQYAIETGQHPAKTTEQNIKRYKEQLDNIGFSYDWSREVKTSDPDYYKWTQWIFLQLFNAWYNNGIQKAATIKELTGIFEKEGNKNINAATSYTETFTSEEWLKKPEKEQQEILMHYRLAYQTYSDVNWCPYLGTVLANDEIKDGVSERGGHPIVKKSMRQWFLRITAYAERLLKALDDLSWTDSMKEMQRNWIGKSQGATIQFKVESLDCKVEVFTTRPDTIFGCTFMVLAPEHELGQTITTHKQKEAVEEYIEQVQARSERERLSEKKVSGVFTGAYATHPFTGENIPIWIADYVLSGYGTGAIMAVPAHDSRDYAFAKHFNILIQEVVAGGNIKEEAFEAKDGEIINSDFLNGLKVKQAIARAIEVIEAQGIGTRQINYRLRDAAYSRQRYWGEPFPIYYKDDMPYALDESQLPLTLPSIETYKPTEDGDPPLARAENWKTEDGYPLATDTMPGYAGSSWYFFRYMDPNNQEAFASEEALNYWQDVDLYIGGTEHATGHLLYARFWTHFLHDLGKVPVKEPFKKLVNQGMIQGMSEKIFMYKVRSSSIQLYHPITKRLVLVNISQNALPIYVTGDIYNNFLKGSKTEENPTNIPVQVNIPIDCVTDNYVNLSKLISNYNKFSNGVFILNDGTFWIKNKLYSFKDTGSPVENIDITKIIDCHTDETFKKFKSISEVEKMSKSKLNVVNPDDIIEKYGADTFRMYEMFLGPIEMHKPWDTKGIDGVHRFLKKLWRLFHDETGNIMLIEEKPIADELKILHKTIKKITEDIERLSLNTCISAFMVCVNELTDIKCQNKQVLKELLILLSPFAPHISEELWQKTGHIDSVTKADFPEHEEKYLKENTFEYPVSVNGKMRHKIKLALSLSMPEIEKEVLATEEIQKWLHGKQPKNVIIVLGRIINIVI